MMTKKEELKYEVLMGMKFFVDSNTFTVLDETLTKALYKVDVVNMETLPAAREMTNEYIWELYMVRKAPRLRPKTVEGYQREVYEFSQFINKSLLHVNEFDIENYLLQNRGKNQNISLNNKRRRLRAFFDWMRKCKLISENPAENIEQFVEEAKPIKVLSAVEVEQLKGACAEPIDRALIEFFRSTAMRVGEAAQVNINSVNWHNGELLIHGHKGHAYRTVFLDEVAIKYLLIYIESRGLTTNSSQPLFVPITRNQGKPCSTAHIRDLLAKISKRAGLIVAATPHDFRRTTATNIIKRGGSEADAGLYLGHKPASVTGRHYTFYGQDHIKKIFDSYVREV